MRALREIAGPFVVAPPGGTRVRTRLRVSGMDAAVLREVGGYLGSLASADLAARCAEGRLDAKQRARSRQVRKRELTAKSSSRWAGALTRTSEDAYQLAYRNLLAERRSLLARMKRIQTRLAVTAGKRAGRVHGYPTAAGRHAKTIRIQRLRTRLAEVEQQLGTGRVSVCRGGKALLRKRNNLAGSGLTETRWRERWAASRLFITADGEKDKTWGNETIRWNPDQDWLEIRLPAPLARLANRPSGRYRLSCPAGFTYRGGDVAAQAATGAVRYDISLDPARGRWYLDASWRTPATGPVTLARARQGTVVAVDVNAGVAATGACILPAIPGIAGAIPPSITTLTPLAYRDPGQLPDGGVLVVGASATGVQLAGEIHRSGRPVTLAAGEHVRLPRTYRSRDIFWWLEATGLLAERYDQVDDLTRARHLPSPQLTGTPEAVTTDLNTLTAQGVRIVGRLGRITDGVAQFSGALPNTCTLADLKMNRFLTRADQWATASGLDDGLPPPHRFAPTHVDPRSPLELNLTRGEITTVLWATGFRPDHSWLDIPVRDRTGRIRHDGGVVTDTPGLYLLGMPVLRTRASTYIHGAAADTDALAGHLHTFLNSQHR